MNKLLLKNILALPLLFCWAISADAQTPPGSQNPAPVNSSIRQADKEIDIRERLVTLALQNPNYEIADRKVAIAGYQVKKAKGSWLSAIAVQGNLNEFAFKGTQVVNDVRIAKENFSIAQAEKNQHFREIKVLVLSKYEDYLLAQQKLDFQSQVTQDARAAYLAAEKDFQEGAIKQDDYNKSYRNYTDEKIRQLEYIHNYNVIKLEMESIIGISMNDLMKK
jgi:outer membrane protein TolC